MRNQLTDSFSGKLVEPKNDSGGLDAVSVIDKVTLTKVLSWYSTFGEADKIKAYAISYMSKYMDKEKVNAISKLSDFEFRTYGSICRMMTRGYIFDDNIHRRLQLYFEHLYIKSQKEKQQVVQEIVVKPKTVADIFKKSDSLDMIDLGMDAIMEGRSAKFAKSADDKTSVTLIKNYAATRIREIQRDFKENTMNKKKTSLLITFLESVETTLASQKVNKSKIVRKVSPLKIVQTVKHSTESLYAIKPILPIDVLNKKKMYVFDKKSRKLIIFIATGTGFSFKGTTLQSFDVEKSKMKTIRKPEEFFKVTPTMSSLNRMYADVKYDDSPHGGRFNENMLIVCVS